MTPTCQHGKEYGGMGVGCCHLCDEQNVGQHLARTTRRNRLIMLSVIVAYVFFMALKLLRMRNP